MHALHSLIDFEAVNVAWLSAFLTVLLLLMLVFSLYCCCMFQYYLLELPLGVF